MFTGLVEEVGTIVEIRQTDAGVELRIDCSYADLVSGESVSVAGVCLTVIDKGDGWFKVAAMVMTIGRTTVGDWRVGDTVNLERAMKADSRFGGHIVQGHVDAVATVVEVVRVEDTVLVTVNAPQEVLAATVLHGSVTLDGVSLTVNSLESDKLQVALIDYTLRHTSLSTLREGSRVNVETDVIGKYVQRLVAPYLNK
jgi:riboflavin synthase